MKDRVAFQGSTAFRSSMRKGMGLSRKTRAQDDMDDLFRGKGKAKGTRAEVVGPHGLEASPVTSVPPVQ